MTTEEKLRGSIQKGAETESAPGKRELSTPWSPMSEMERLFESFYPRSLFRAMPWEFPEWADFKGPFTGKLPRIDVIDYDDKVEVKAELPGVRKEDLDVSLSQNILTIRGHTRYEKSEGEEGEYQRREISRGSFSRSVTLPTEIDANNIQSTFKDGILALMLPKNQRAQRHSIKIEG